MSNQSNHGAGYMLFAIVCVLAAGYAVIKWILPGVGFVLSYAWHALVASVHAGAAAGTAGLMAGNALLAIAAFVVAIHAIVAVSNVVQKASEKPFQWLSPILAVFSALIPKIVKASYPKSVVGELALDGSIAMLFVIGIILLKQKMYWGWKILIGIVTYVIGPSAILVAQFKSREGKLQEALRSMGFNEWLAIGMFLILGAVAILLAFIERKNEEGRGN